jgi:hypothetical protein
MTKNTIILAIMAMGSMANASPAPAKLQSRAVTLGCATSSKSPKSDDAKAAAQYLYNKGQTLCQNKGSGCTKMADLSK